MGRVVREFLSDGITCLYLIGRLGSEGRTTISAQDMNQMTGTCKNLDVLVIGCVRVESWPKPSETLPWTSLKQLSLLNVEMNADLFSGVGLHHIMPNLEVFIISVNDDRDKDSPMTLPEFENCENLRHISLRCETFLGQYLIKSLPSSLEYMDGCIFVLDSCRKSLKVMDELKSDSNLKSLAIQFNLKKVLTLPLGAVWKFSQIHHEVDLVRHRKRPKLAKLWVGVGRPRRGRGLQCGGGRSSNG